ncbi:MAG: anaerobic ribonucleoside-triphosphate reductase activating protein [Candidatus Paceibacterota bacterium]|jgi:pyruvate formate lyase activating enzyme
MRIGGFQKISLIDYPEHLSSIVWTPTCNFRCPFCYNKDLALGDAGLFSEDEVLQTLKERQGKIEAVVITGGEPTLQKDLKDFIKKIKALNYLVKLDTNGTNPEIIRDLLEEKFIDYIAMDIKAPRGKYKTLSGIENSDIQNIQSSIEIIKKLAPDYEFRTTIVPDLLNKDDILSIAEWLSGSKRYILQQFAVPGELIDKNLAKSKSYPKEFFDDLKSAIKDYFTFCEIRGF